MGKIILVSEWGFHYFDIDEFLAAESNLTGLSEDQIIEKIMASELLSGISESHYRRNGWIASIACYIRNGFFVMPPYIYEEARNYVGVL